MNKGIHKSSSKQRPHSRNMREKFPRTPITPVNDMQSQFLLQDQYGSMMDKINEVNLFQIKQDLNYSQISEPINKEDYGTMSHLMSEVVLKRLRFQF